MNKREPAIPPIDEALKLDGNPEHVKEYYAKWASSYDDDVVERYTGPGLIVMLLSECIDGGNCGLSRDRSALTIADVGCGTGLVGIELDKAEFTQFDGMDISPDMVEMAKSLEIYRELIGNVDMNQPINPEWSNAYDVALCCGVFTLGHVEPTMLYQLIDMVKPGGIIITSTRTSYYDSTNYQEVSDEIESKELVKLKNSVMDAPYTEDSDAHYWVYQVI